MDFLVSKIRIAITPKATPRVQYHSIFLSGEWEVHDITDVFYVRMAYDATGHGVETYVLGDVVWNFGSTSQD